MTQKELSKPAVSLFHPRNLGITFWTSLGGLTSGALTFWFSDMIPFWYAGLVFALFVGAPVTLWRWRRCRSIWPDVVAWVTLGVAGPWLCLAFYFLTKEALWGLGPIGRTVLRGGAGIAFLGGLVGAHIAWGLSSAILLKVITGKLDRKYLTQILAYGTGILTTIILFDWFTAGGLGPDLWTFGVLVGEQFLSGILIGVSIVRQAFPILQK